MHDLLLVLHLLDVLPELGRSVTAVLDGLALAVHKLELVDQALVLFKDSLKIFKKMFHEEMHVV